MSTINSIIKERGYTKEQLLDCEQNSFCNGMGAKGGIQWTDRLRKLKYFNGEKERKLLFDLDLLSDIHDIAYDKGNGLKDYIQSNYNLATDIMGLLYWSNTFSRILIFIMVFFGTTFFGFNSFNWK